MPPPPPTPFPLPLLHHFPFPLPHHPYPQPPSRTIIAPRRHLHLHRRAATHPTSLTLTPSHRPFHRRPSQDHNPTRPFSTTPTCPPPTLPHAPSPAVTQNLDIDYKLPLSGSMPAHHQHVIIPTGRTDWSSRVEEDDAGVEGGVIRGLKERLGMKGEFGNPFHNVMITASSDPPFAPFASSISNTNTTSQPPPAPTPAQPPPPHHTTPTISALLFPDFLRITSLPTTTSSLTSFTRAFLLPPIVSLQAVSSSPAGEGLSKEKQEEVRQRWTRNEQLRKDFEEEGKVEEIRDVTVLICGHGKRDCRCGIIGPVLEDEFREKLSRSSIFPLKPSATTPPDSSSTPAPTISSTVSQISHIGGHKFAGNIIIYIPKSLSAQGHPLAGMGIWYGRVEPKHVEGIVKMTVEQGVVIKELWRGGLGPNGVMVRLPA